MSNTQRVVSIDALRGADMLLLAGGASLLKALSSWCGGEMLCRQLTHAEWGGSLTCWDLVMPLFIFIVGASMPFAFARYRQQGLGRTLWRVLRRCALLFLLGMLVQGNLASAVPERMSLFCNTLQAIAEGYFIAALCFIFGGGVRTRLVTCLCCLVAYWAALRFIPYGESPGGLFLPDDNLAIWVDRTLQGRWQDGTPYSWVLTSLSFGALTLMGSLAGEALRLAQSRRRTLLILCGAGLTCLLVGLLISPDTPIIKHIYTVSMTLWSGGCCFLLLAAFYLAFDAAPRFARFSYPLCVIGSNAMLVYLLTQTPGLRGLSLWQSICTPLFGGISSLADSASQALFEFLSLALLFCLLLFLHRHKAFLRV